MICPRCGRDNAPGVAFCAGCGAPLANAGMANPGYVGGFRPMNAPVPGKGLGIASMVLGIISLVFFCVFWFSIPCAIVGAALGGAAKSKAAGAPNGMATAGIACSCIALGLAIFFFFIAMAGGLDLIDSMGF